MTKLIAIASAAAVGALLAACGQAPATTAAAAKPAAATSSPPSCRQLYETWKHSTVPTRLQSALDKVDSAGTNDDFPQLESALKAAGPDAVAVQSDPVPRCADPAGYYGQVLAKIVAAADNARSQSGLGSLMLAEVPLKTLPAIGAKLNAELDKTVGKGY